MRGHCGRETTPSEERSLACVDQDVLQALAAGIAPPGTMEKHGEHIAGCKDCAVRLQRYLFEFGEELTAEEEILLSELESSKPEGQKRLVEQILRHLGTFRNTGRSDE